MVQADAFDILRSIAAGDSVRGIVACARGEHLHIIVLCPCLLMTSLYTN